tara:strand:- start:36 stop:335 length:300 start_codon:yes stop_codon:yes gene_type:complete
MTTEPIRFRAKPSRIIRVVVNLPVPKTTALGAVATGSIKAQLALNTAGSMRIAGLISAAKAAEPRIGISNMVVAVLLVISVRKVTTRHMQNMSTSTGTF